MYAALRHYHLDSDSYAEVGKSFVQGFSNQLCTSEGFRAYCLADGGKGVVFSLSMFETVDQAKLSNAMARSWVEKNLRDHISEPPEIAIGRVGIARTFAGINRQHIRYFDHDTFG